MFGWKYTLIFAISLILTVTAEKKLIPILKKKAAQPIYTEGPSWHLSKSGTPTMGGLGFLIAVTVSGLIGVLMIYKANDLYYARSFLLTLAYGLANALIGIIDDSAKIRKRENAGLSPIEKLLLQGAVASLFLVARSAWLKDGTQIFFSSFAMFTTSSIVTARS